MGFTLNLDILRRSHQASPQTNIIGVARARSQVHLRILDVCISPHLPLLQVIKIEALSKFGRTWTIKVVSIDVEKNPVS